MTISFLWCLVFALVFHGIGLIGEGFKATPVSWKTVAIGSGMAVAGFLLALGPISLGR